MKAHFLKLLDYSVWANRRLMACLESSTIMNNKIFLLFSHVLTAEEVWHCRAKGEEAPVQRLWEVYPTETLSRLLEENHTHWTQLIQDTKATPLNREILYLNSKGESFSTPLNDILTHLVNHGTHHRAQICSMLKQEKIIPPVLDYIAYVREKKPIVAE